MQKCPSVRHRSPERHQATTVVTGLPHSLLCPRAKCHVWHMAGTLVIGQTMNLIGWE